MSPSLDIIQVQQCSSLDQTHIMVKQYHVRNPFSEREWPECTCPAYKFSKRTINFGGRMVPPLCKHIEQVRAEVCGWSAQWSIAQTEEQRDQMICPRCGKSTVWVRVAV